MKICKKKFCHKKSQKFVQIYHLPFRSAHNNLINSCGDPRAKNKLMQWRHANINNNTVTGIAKSKTVKSHLEIVTQDYHPATITITANQSNRIRKVPERQTDRNLIFNSTGNPCRIHSMVDVIYDSESDHEQEWCHELVKKPCAKISKKILTLNFNPF